VKSSTLRTAAGRVFLRRFLLFSVAGCLALAPVSSRASTVRVSELPGATSMGAAPVESSSTFSNHAGTLTADLLSLLSTAEMRSPERNVSDQFFTFENVRSSSSESSSERTNYDAYSYSGGMGSAERYSTPAPSLISWSLARTGNSGQSNPVAVTALAVPAQTIAVAPEVDTGAPFKHKKGHTQVTSSAPPNPFTQPNNEFGLSTAGDNTIQVHKISYADGGDGGGTSAVPEPRFNSLLLFAGLMSAAFVYRRKSSAA